MVWILRWKSGTFPASNFDFCIQHSYFVNNLGQKFLFGFK